jgi:hypothetical protein
LIVCCPGNGGVEANATVRVPCALHLSPLYDPKMARVRS